MRPEISFFVIGAARSGTTSLYRALSEHPEVYVPDVKEPRFFRENWDKGWDWYADIYRHAQPNRKCGDFSPSYSTSNSWAVARRIFEAYPHARILYIVRNPIDCALSNWRMTAEIQNKQISFSEALDDPVWSNAVLNRCMFFKQISYFKKYYPRDQIKVITLEDMQSYKDSMVPIQEFLGLSPQSIRFPRANASSRKPNRPAIPPVPMETRRKFLSIISDDAHKLFKFIGMPEKHWNLSEDYRGWVKDR